MKDKYYGPNKIVNSEVTDDSVLLTLDNKKVVELSPKMAKAAITEEKKDLTELRDVRLRPVAKEMLETMLEWDVRIGEVEYLQSLVVTSLNQNIEKASEKLWHTTNEERTVKMIDDVLKEDAD